MKRADILILFTILGEKHVLNIILFTTKYNSSCGFILSVLNFDFFVHMIPYQYLQRTFVLCKSGIIFHCMNITKFFSQTSDRYLGDIFTYKSCCNMQSCYMLFCICMYISKINLKRIIVILVDIVKLLTSVFPPEKNVRECLSSAIFSPTWYVTRILYLPISFLKKVFQCSFSLHFSYHEGGCISFHMFKKYLRASLVAQWLRICLPVQGTWVRALAWEDPTCRGATKPVRHNY